MELTVKTNEFGLVLRLVQAVTERKTTIPVLGTVLLTADPKGLTVTGTDLELGAVCRCPATISKPGTLAVPAQRLAEYVKMLPEADLHLKEQSSCWLALSCGRSKCRIAGTAAHAFPELPGPPATGVTVSCGALARLVEKVVFAISTEQNSVALGGALLKLDRSGLTMVATDGHRLALATSRVDLPDSEKPVEVLIPRKALLEFLRFSDSRNDQPVRCSVTDNHLFFTWSERLLLSRRLTGSFPNYERVLPTAGCSVVLERNEFRASIERVSRFSDSQTRCIAIEVSPGRLALHAEESNIGESEEVLPVAYDGEPVRIGFNASYLCDFLARTEHRSIRFSFRNGASAAELQPDVPDAGAYRYVVMPMAIREESAEKQ